MKLKHIPLILGVLLAAGWFVFLRPVELGGPAAYVVVSGDSMLPTLEPGDLVVTKAEETYDEGEVAVYEIPEGQPGSESGARIIHRLVSSQDGVWTAQGDNRDQVDPWTPSDSDVVGAQWYVVPGGGGLLVKALQPAVVAAVAGGLAAFLVVTSSGRKRKQEPEQA